MFKNILLLLMLACICKLEATLNSDLIELNNKLTQLNQLLTGQVPAGDINGGQPATINQGIVPPLAQVESISNLQVRIKTIIEQWKRDILIFSQKIDTFEAELKSAFDNLIIALNPIVNYLEIIEYIRYTILKDTQYVEADFSRMYTEVVNRMPNRFDLLHRRLKLIFDNFHNELNYEPDLTKFIKNIAERLNDYNKYITLVKNSTNKAVNEKTWKYKNNSVAVFFLNINDILLELSGNKRMNPPSDTRTFIEKEMENIFEW